MGTAATAEPVSWQAGAMTSTRPAPVPSASCERRGPRLVPGGTMSGRNPVGMSKDSSRPAAHSPRRGSKNWVVVAMENSLALVPVSQKLKRSGRVRKVRAMSS